ncbi:MAG: hypothetical protein WBD10_09660 [Acidobacteriaceae bacterium]
MGRLLIAAFLLTTAAFAQTAPTLRSRNQPEPQPTTRQTKGFSTLPEEASGEYVLDVHGSIIQITIEHSRLTGYVTRMEGDTALTLFFDKASINGNRLSFTTKTVHGLRYAFRGVITRGEAPELSSTGYYRLTGELTAYRGAAPGPAPAHVSLKSTPRLP